MAVKKNEITGIYYCTEFFLKILWIVLLSYIIYWNKTVPTDLIKMFSDYKKQPDLVIDPKIKK